MAISRIAGIAVPVTDHHRALALYRDVMGFTVIHDREEPGGHRAIHLVAPCGGASIVLVSPSNGQPAGSALGGTLQVADMLDAVERLAYGGFDVTVLVGQSGPGTGVWAQFNDHDGNAWLLWQPAEDPSKALPRRVLEAA